MDAKLTFDQILIISKAFYKNRFQPDFTPVSHEDAAKAFQEANLTGEFWKL